MSRAFVKEDDHEEIPRVPPRAALPDGATNYVTTYGLSALKKERENLLLEKQETNKLTESEARVAKGIIDQKLQQIDERIASAVVLEPKDTHKDEVRFGAKVTFHFTGQKGHQTLQIVGVDEANIKEQKVSFLSPIARALTGKKKGEKGVLTLGAEDRAFEVKAIEYPT
jgi:transcription elongation factor GreB